MPRGPFGLVARETFPFPFFFFFVVGPENNILGEEGGCQQLLMLLILKSATASGWVLSRFGILEFQNMQKKKNIVL